MSIYNIAGNQYQATTGRKRRFPYSSYIASQVPRLYQAKQYQENQDYANRQIALEEAKLDESRRSSEANLEESRRQADTNARLTQEQIDEAEKQALIGNTISGAQTLGLGYYGGSKLGLWGGSQAGSTGLSAATSTGPTVEAAASGSQVASTGGSGLGAGLSTAGGIAAGVVADELMARRIAGTEDDPRAAWENNVRGITRYGGATPGMTALIERGIGRSFSDKVLDIADPLGITKKVEPTIAKYTAATIPKFLGGTGGGTGSETVDKILNPAGTWICTKIKEIVGMTREEWRAITTLKRYSLTNHKDWFDKYLDIGPELSGAMGDSKEFYSDLKKAFVDSVIGLVDGGFLEAAYQAYKAAVFELVDRHKPELREAA